MVAVSQTDARTRSVTSLIHPRGRTAIERADTGRQRAKNLNLSEQSSPETPEVRKVEEPEPHALLASPDVCGLLASVLAVVEREADAAVNDHLMIRQAAFVMLLTFRETLPMSMPLTWPRPRLPMTIRSILFPTA